MKPVILDNRVVKPKWLEDFAIDIVFSDSFVIKDVLY
jgi:hypothetical protein